MGDCSVYGIQVACVDEDGNVRLDADGNVMWQLYVGFASELKAPLNQAGRAQNHVILGLGYGREKKQQRVHRAMQQAGLGNWRLFEMAKGLTRKRAHAIETVLIALLGTFHGDDGFNDSRGDKMVGEELIEDEIKISSKQ